MPATPRRRPGVVHPEILLRNVALSVDLRGAVSRFRVEAAQVTLLPSGRRSIHWRFEGSKGSVTVELPQKQAWDLLDEVQEQSVAERPPHKRKVRRSA